MEKRKYTTPQVEEIRLDNEISLQLASPTIDQGLNKVRRRQNSGQGTEMNDDPYKYETW